MYRFLKVSSLTLVNTNASKKPAHIHTSSYLCSFCKFHHLQATKLTDSVTSNTKTKVKKLNANNISMLVDKKNPAPKIKTSNSKLNVIQSIRASIKGESNPVEDTDKTLSSSANGPYNSYYLNKKMKTLKKLKKLSKTKNLLDLKLQRNQSTQNVSESTNQKDKEKTNIVLNATNDIDNSNPTEDVKINPVAFVKQSSLIKYLENSEIFDDEELDNNKKSKKKNSLKKWNKISDLHTPNEENFKLLNKKYRQESNRQSSISFFDVCLKCGKLEKAYKILLLLRNNKSKKTKWSLVQDTALYNIFLKEFASIADLMAVKNLINLMNELSIKMIPESYAFVFECVARSQDPSKETGFLSSLKKQMDERNISFNDVLTKPTFKRDELEKVLQSVRLLEPDFEPFFDLPNVNYNCRLLDNIYNNRSPESPAKGLFSLSDLKELKKKQINVEISGQVQIKSVANQEEPTPQVLSARQKVRELEDRWREDVSIAFERNLETLKVRERKLETSHLHPYLIALDKEEYIEAIMSEVKLLVETAESYSSALTNLCKDLGLQLFKKYEAKVQRNEGLIDTTLESYAEYCEWYLDGGNHNNGRIKWQFLEHKARKKGKSLDAKVEEWPVDIIKSIGRFLYDIILKDLKINFNCSSEEDIFVPAFYVIYRNSLKTVKEEIRSHPGLTKLYNDSQPPNLIFKATLVPSLSPPRPWSSVDSGGYLITKTSIMRMPYGAVQQWKRLREVPQEQLYPALDCLNQLGAIPWKVNTSVLDVAIKVFQDGGSTKLTVPQPPSALPDVPFLTEDASKEERTTNFKMRMELKRRKNEMYSLWCDALYKLSLANHYRNEIFWLPHNMDFRGRVYPIPPHLSQMGSDFARSMLTFAQEKPLGAKGLDWLKIHVINLTGFKKKESIENRLKYANEILDKILDSAENPLTGEMWWSTSDEPWQTLAACMEISKALKCPNPAEYQTGFAIHQDGSCNGLQHYAALGRDQVGAESVNLCPFEKPQDVYSDVVVLVEQGRKKDAENGLEIAQVLEGFIQRKVIKQTIMTTVYGVTKFGAKLQISKQLKDVEDFPQDQIWPASGYLVHKTFESLRTMFTSAKEIQDWFTECAQVICTVRGKSIEWVTPLGLPVVQPYTKPRTVGYHHVPIGTFERPNIMKQKNAFPPNFVHSLDSTHMMLTSLKCEQAGITFMSVHDCFWTHACTVEIMNEICRKQFIALHSEPILEDLSRYLLDLFAYPPKELQECSDMKLLEMRKDLNKVLARVPQKGTFDLQKVLTSTYFFS